MEKTGDETSNVLYVSDASLNLVYKFSTTGTLLAQWGDQGGTTLNEPQGLALHNGNLFVADAGNSRIVEYDGNGNVVATLQPRDGEFYLFNYPTGLFFDNQGNLYVSDNSDKIYRFDTNLTLTGQYDGNGQLDFPANGCEDASGNIYVANFNTNQVMKLQQNGTQVSVWGQAGTGVGQFSDTWPRSKKPLRTPAARTARTSPHFSARSPKPRSFNDAGLGPIGPGFA